jgi:C1A family cysteine protease
MRFIALFVLAAVCALAAAHVEKVQLKSELANVDFELFKTMYNKQYSTAAEEVMRLDNFKKSLARVAHKNFLHGSNVFGINKFSDMSVDEFKATILKSKPVHRPHHRVMEITEVGELPTAFDWAPLGAVTPVKDQGQCGSCWAFSATETIESAWIMAGKGTNESTILAPQQIVDCDTTDLGCDGGDTPTAYEYVIKAGGMESEKEYPYKAEDGKCKFAKNKVVASIKKWEYVIPTSSHNETAMQVALVANGPLSICVEADTWQDYNSGVITRGCGQQLDHCVQITGFGETDKGVPYWLIRNSWNTDWGMDGYILVERNKNLCGVSDEVTLPLV